MAGLKPITHGYSDPTEIPYCCKKCKFYNHNGKDFPKCDKNENGRFVPYFCYVPKPIPETENKK